MNQFAESVFSIILNWLKTLAKSLFDAFTSDSSGQSGFVSWFAENWLILVSLVVVLGLLTDFCIRLARWKPHLVWKSRLRKVKIFLSGKSKAGQAFNTGYDTGVDEIKSSTPPLSQQSFVNSPQPANRVSVDDYDYLPRVQNQASSKPRPLQTPSAPSGSSPRRRRANAFKALRDFITEDDSSPVTSLSSSIDRKDAFYEPVYPVSRQNREDGK